MLTLVGADEFVVDADAPDPKKTGNATPDTVRQAYDALTVDAGYLSTRAAAWFGDTLPQHFVRVGVSPVVRRLQVGGISVALVFFPPEPSATTSSIPSDSSEATPNRVLGAVLVAARSVADADIRIGLSPWGFQRERQALPALAEVFDVVLGGGTGAPLVGEVNPALPSLLWSRAEREGRSLMVLDLLDIPAPGLPRNWTIGLFSQCREVSLDAHIPTDLRMERLLSPRPHK